MVDISEFFRVTTRIEVGGVTTLDFGRGLIITTDPTLGASGSGRVQYFTDIDAVKEVFDDEDLIAAATQWFSYEPYPQGLYIGRWPAVDVATVLRSGTPASAIGSLAVENASFRAASQDFLVDLSGQTTFAGVATAISAEFSSGPLTGGIGSVTTSTEGEGYNTSGVQVSVNGGSGTGAAFAVVYGASGDSEGDHIKSITVTNPGSGYLPSDTLTLAFTGEGSPTTNFVGVVNLEREAPVAALNGATMTYVNGRYVLTLTGAQELDPAYFEVHSQGLGEDISSDLGMVQASSPVYIRGGDAQSPSAAASEIIGLVSDVPKYLFMDPGAPTTYGDAETEVVTDMWTYAEASDLIFGFTDTSAAAREAGEAGSLLARANSAQLGNTLPCVGDADRQPHIGALAGLSSINWDQPASIITLFGKTLPGTAATSVTSTELANIRSKRGNVYTEVGGLPTFIEGTQARAGYWSDAVAFNLWMKNELEQAIWNAARASRRLTIAILNDALDGAMAGGVLNGGIEPGRTVTGQTKADIISLTGNHDFDGVLQAGYLIWIGALSDQPQIDINNRQAPPIKIFAKGSVAIHQADVDLVFQG